MVRGISFIIALLLTANIALAQSRTRPNAAPEDDACRADTHHYCQHVFPAQRDLAPDQFEMLSCLQEHRAKLSRAYNEHRAKLSRAYNEMLKGRGV